MAEFSDILLARIEERTEQLSRDIARVELKLEAHTASADARAALFEGRFVTRAEFEPIKRIVYGVVALVLASVFGALLALVVRK